MEIILSHQQHTTSPEPPPQLTRDRHTRRPPGTRIGWTTWWSSRGAPTRSHPELGRENPQRPWYCASRHGRVGRRQVFQPIQIRPSTHCVPSPAPPRAQPKGTHTTNAGWSSPVARQAHNLKAAGSNPAPATNLINQRQSGADPSAPDHAVSVSAPIIF
jgi:hypothetical protein